MLTKQNSLPVRECQKCNHQSGKLKTHQLLNAKCKVSCERVLMMILNNVTIWAGNKSEVQWREQKTEMKKKDS